jgi:hypothetical protein
MEQTKDLTDGQPFMQWVFKKKQEDGSFKRDWLTSIVGIGFPIFFGIGLIIAIDQWIPLVAIGSTAIAGFWIGSYNKYKTLQSGHSS